MVLDRLPGWQGIPRLAGQRLHPRWLAKKQALKQFPAKDDNVLMGAALPLH